MKQESAGPLSITLKQRDRGGLNSVGGKKDRNLILLDHYGLIWPQLTAAPAWSAALVLTFPERHLSGIDHMRCDSQSHFKGEATLTYGFNKGPSIDVLRHKADSLLLRLDTHSDQRQAISNISQLLVASPPLLTSGLFFLVDVFG